jgi:hypothetical protein
VGSIDAIDPLRLGDGLLQRFASTACLDKPVDRLLEPRIRSPVALESGKFCRIGKRPEGSNGNVLCPGGNGKEKKDPEKGEGAERSSQEAKQGGLRRSSRTWN